MEPDRELRTFGRVVADLPRLLAWSTIQGDALESIGGGQGQ